jgi:hypothetical protein
LAISTTGDSLFFIEPFSNKIKILLTKTGEVRWLAGSDTSGYVDKTLGKFARFSRPQDIALKGNLLYVADALNHKIRTINIKTTEVKTYAGSTSGFKDSTLTFAKFNRPATLEWVNDRLFVGEDAGLRIRVINSTLGTVKNWAGNGNLGSQDGLGSAARFKGIFKLSYNPVSKLLYVAGYSNEGIMRTVGVDVADVKTMVSTAGYQNGFIKDARFLGPQGLYADTILNQMIVAESGNSLIRSIKWYSNTAPKALIDTVYYIKEDAALLANPLFARNISCGTTRGDTLQKAGFLLKDPSSKLQILSLDSLGKLLLQPRPDSNGTTVLRIRLKDNGGTAWRGVDTTIYYSKIKITAVNDAPTFTNLSTDAAVHGQPRIGPNFISNSKAGPFDERNQNLSFKIAVDRPLRFTQLPYIENNAIKYTPKLDSLGIVNARIICRDNGGTAFGGVDSSEVHYFQILILNMIQVQDLEGGKLVVYPNPARDRISFLNLPADAKNLYWINTLGQTVAVQNLTAESTVVPENITGMYTIKTDGHLPMTTRILIVK